MIQKLLSIVCAVIAGCCLVFAKPPQSTQSASPNKDGIMSGLNMGNTKTLLMVDINPMQEDTKEKLNKAAANYRSNNRNVFADIGTSMLSGGVTAVVDVIGTEIINLIQIRSKQKKAWQEMRQREFKFVDSLQSVKGQSDFYARLSNYGPLDPSDMNFDGITFTANKDGEEVMKMVCHIDTTKLDHLFMHSKFYLVVDTIVFHPYRSFLPNLGANRISPPDEKASEDEKEYWNTISRFSFEDYPNSKITMKMDLSSSWINELVQVYHDVPLGSFSLDFEIGKQDLLGDSVYVYSRRKAMAENLPLIEMKGDCFVVPRSYMPVSANNPSWGTGEYKMKVVLSQTCRYNPDDNRSKNWRHDYKQLLKMQNHGKAKNEYVEDVITTFRDNKYTILKATYTPLLKQSTTILSGTVSGSAGMVKSGSVVLKGSQGSTETQGAPGGKPNP